MEGGEWGVGTGRGHCGEVAEGWGQGGSRLRSGEWLRGGSGAAVWRHAAGVCWVAQHGAEGGDALGVAHTPAYSTEKIVPPVT